MNTSHIFHVLLLATVGASRADEPAFQATPVYDRVTPAQSVVLEIRYRLPAGYRILSPFRIAQSETGLKVALYSNGTLLATAADTPRESHADQSAAADAGGVLARDIELPASFTPAASGTYEIRVVRHTVLSRDQPFPIEMPAAPTTLTVLPSGTPTPERPRPWKEYDDPTLYPELKRFLLAMPMHRFEQAGLSRQVWLEVFCDPDFPKEKRMAKFEHLMWHQRPFNEKLLPLALSEKEDEDIRLRALMLLGGMEKNDAARKELIKRYWLKDDAGKPSALYRMAFLYGGGGEAPISYGRVDPSPLVRAFGLWSAGRRYRGEECIQIARTLTNCVEKMPVEIFTDLRPSLAQKDIGTYARDAIAGWERMFRDPWPSDRPKPVPPPADAAEQAEAVRKLFR